MEGSPTMQAMITSIRLSSFWSVSRKTEQKITTGMAPRDPIKRMIKLNHIAKSLSMVFSQYDLAQSQ